MLHQTIKRIREEKKMTPEEMAERLHLSPRTYSRLGPHPVDRGGVRYVPGRNGCIR